MEKKDVYSFHFVAFGLATPGPVLAGRMDRCGTWVYLAARSTPSELRDILIWVRGPECSIKDSFIMVHSHLRWDS